MLEPTLDKLTSPLRRRWRNSPLPEFMRWWGSELLGIVPKRWRERLMPPKPRILIVPAASGGGDLRIWRADREPRALDVFGAGEDPALLATRWRDLVAEFEDGAPEVTLCLDPDQVLQLPVQMPAAVLENLHSALGFQLDQITPFKPDQVYYDQRVLSHDPEHNRINVALCLAPREAVDRLLDRLRAIGIAVHVVDVLVDEAVPTTAGFNLLPEALRPRYVHARARFNLLLGLALAVLVVAVMAEFWVMRQRTAGILAEEADRLRGQALAVAELEKQLQDSLQAANYLAQKRSADPLAIAVLDELTRILPDDVWLQQFQLEGNEISVQGKTAGAQRVLGIIDASPLFEAPEFQGQINVDRDGAETFRIRARIKSPDAAAEAEEGA